MTILLWVAGLSTLFAQMRNVLSVPDCDVVNTSEILLPVCMDNSSDVVAVQFTMEISSGYGIDVNRAQMNELRKNGHSMKFRSLGGNRYKCLISSARNNKFSGNEGVLLTVPLRRSSSNTATQCRIALSEVILAAANGDNTVTDIPSGSVRFGHLDGEVVCSGNESNSFDFYSVSSVFDYRWSLKDIPTSIEGYVENGKSVIPPMLLLNEGMGEESVTYTVSATYGGIDVYSFEYSIAVRPSLLGAFFTSTPRNKSVVSANAIKLTWNNIINAVYDVYVWKKGEQRPDTPLARNLASTQYAVNGFCEIGETYEWCVVAHNECQSIANEVQSFSVRNLPDLHVTRVNASEAIAGGRMSVEWEVKNDGSGSTEDVAWNDYIWLVPDMKLGTSTTGSKLLKTVGNVKALDAGESYINTCEVALDERVYGNYNILVTSDMPIVTNIDWMTETPPYPYSPAATGYLAARTNESQSKVSEPTSNGMKDNFFYIEKNISLPPLPDLCISAVEVLLDGAPVSEVFGGSTVDVVLTIKNQGNAASGSKSVANVLYTYGQETPVTGSMKSVANSRKSISLAPGETCQERYTVTIPSRYYGDMYFHAYTDLNDAVFELANTENNWGTSRKINVIALPGADLIPTYIGTQASSVSPNQNVTVSYTVENMGAGAPDATRWTDRIYLSSSPNGLDESAQLLASVPVEYGSDKYSKDINVSVGSLSGECYLYVVTDAKDNVFEYEGEENNTLVSGNALVIVRPDLTVELTKIYSDSIISNEKAAFEWKIKNQGTGDLNKVKVSDSFYAAATPDGANSIYLGTISNELWIPSGGEKVLKGTLPIPYTSDVDALRYIFVKTDTEHAVAEENEGNNTSNAIQRWCKLNPKPVPAKNGADLVVDEVEAPSAAVTQTYVAAKVKLRNSGNVGAGVFQIGAYLSDDAVLSSNDVLVTSGLIKSLAVDETMDIDVSFYVPEGSSSKRYLLFVADTDNSVSETDENNNLVSRAISITPSQTSVKRADISIPFVKVPETVKTSEYVTVNWTCENKGVADASPFTTAIYLSADDAWSSNDVLLATQRTQALKAGTSVEYQSHIYISDVYEGDMYLILVSDVDNVLDEDTKANNQNSVAVNIVKVERPEPIIPDPTSSPDLIISRVTVDKATVMAATDIVVNWTCTNRGTSDAIESMAGIYLSDDATLSADDKLLGTQYVAWVKTGMGIDYQSVVNIPETYSGGKYLIVCADITNTVNEHDEANNSASVALTIDRRPAAPNAQLLALAVEAPATVYVQQDFSTKWSVHNSGTLDAGTFMNALYLSDDASWSSDDVLLGTRITESLSAGGHVDCTFDASLAQGQTGKKYLIFRTDIYNSITESTKTDNYVVKPITVSSVPTEKKYADLAIGTVLLPDSMATSSGIKAQWTVANSGNGDATSPFVCAIYISNDAQYSEDDALICNERIASLKQNGQVELNSMITVDDKYHGNKYLIFRTNVYGSVQEVETGNNTKAIPVTIACAPLPDLSVRTLSCEKELTQGQEFALSVTVVNNGETDTKKSRWTTEYYLSADATFNKAKAFKIGSSTHSGVLKPGEEYTDSVSVTLPQDISGNYLLFAYVDATEAIYESNRANNVSKGRIVMIYPVEERPVDLSIAKLDAPLSVTAGENITLTYNVVNNGQYAASGTLRDVIYLSEDEIWDYNDVQVGVVTGKVNIEPGQEFVRSATGRIVNVPEGKYYFIVKTNSTRSIPEVSEDDNVAVNYMASLVEYRTLTLGAAETVNTCGYYKIDINEMPKEQTVGFTLTHQENAAAGLYVGYEKVPSTALYDFASFALASDTKSVILPVAEAGRYYILAQDNSTLVNNDGYAFSLTGGTEWSDSDMSLSVDGVHFGATSLSITEGGTDGWISTEIKGAMFDSIMDFRLALDKNVIPAEHVVFHDQTSSYVTFNLRNAEVGTYDVVSELPVGVRSTLPDGFRVIPGVQSRLGIKVEAPRVVHSGSHSPVSLAFANGGTNDIQIKEILIRSQGSYLGKSVSDFKDRSNELHLVPEGYEADRFGYISIAPGTQKVINFFMEQHAGTSYMTIYIVK